MFNCPNTYAHINEWDELFETANNKMGHSVVLSQIHLLIIFANVSTPQPTEQFCHIYIYIYICICVCVCYY